MKTTLLKNRVVRIPTARWLAYTTAGVASALAGAVSAEAEIHYSGLVDTSFGPNENKITRFRLDQPGDSIVFARDASGSADFFGAVGLESGAFAGSYPVFSYAYVWRLKNLERFVSEARFANGGFGFGTLGTMVRGSRLSFHWRWERSGIDYVGFVFDGGSGKQYGWARVQMKAGSKYAFTLLDYAWADPGEPIKLGQTSSSSSANETKEGSIGLLALGATGLALWRHRRKS